MADQETYRNTRIAFLALGSNLGDRQANLDRALELLSAKPQIVVEKVSSWMENPAVEDAGPEDFLNGVVRISTDLDPYGLLDTVQEIENIIDPERNDRGRERARKMDIDILRLGKLSINDERLQIPHPRMYAREFVMKPLQEVQSDLRHESKAEAERVIGTNPKYRVRRMYLDDLDQVAEMDPKVFGSMHWTRNIFANELSNNNAVYLVAVEIDDKQKPTGKILGYGGAWFILDEMHLMTLGTDPEYRRQGIAEAIIVAFLSTAIQSDINSVTLEVRLSNVAAQKLYEKYDFQRQGIRKNYYENDGESALLLWTECIQDAKFQENFIEQVRCLEKRY